MKFRWRASGLVTAVIAATSLSVAGAYADSTGTITGPLTSDSGVAAPAAPADPGTTTTAQVSQGANPVNIPGATPFEDTPGSTPERVSFVMKETDLSALESSVEAGIHDGFLTPAQFAATYGAPSGMVKGLIDYLSQYGITSTVLPGGVDVQTTGTAAAYDAALSIDQKDYHVPAVTNPDGSTSVPAQTIYASQKNPVLPEPFANFVLAVMGLNNYDDVTGDSVSVPGVGSDTSVLPDSISTATCDSVFGFPAVCHLPSDFASRYGLDPLYAQGAQGQGQTVGVISIGSAGSYSAVQSFWQSFGVQRTGGFSSIAVDGGTKPGDDSEADMDLEQAGAVAPAADVVQYAAPNSIQGFVDALFAAAASNTADSVSASYGISEPALALMTAQASEPTTTALAFDESFLEMAAQGQSAFVSAGDQGAFTSWADVHSTDLSVSVPASSPFTTAAGGTTTPWSAQVGPDSVSVPKERAWGDDYMWQPWSDSQGTSLDQAIVSLIAGGGGGYSSVEPRPSYQQSVSGVASYSAVPELDPTAPVTVSGVALHADWSLDLAPSVTTGTSSGRALPDISADADPFSGYLVGVNGGTTTLGGTSFVAPQLNGAAAVIDSALGRRVGFWNPTLYASAQTADSPLTPLDDSGTDNDNLYYTGTPGTLYNPASGLGTPNLAKLETKFPQ